MLGKIVLILCVGFFVYLFAISDSATLPRLDELAVVGGFIGLLIAVPIAIAYWREKRKR